MIFYPWPKPDLIMMATTDMKGDSLNLTPSLSRLMGPSQYANWPSGLSCGLHVKAAIMDYTPTVGISVRDHKLASLLFDYIIPVPTFPSSPLVPPEVIFDTNTLELDYPGNETNDDFGRIIDAVYNRIPTHVLRSYLLDDINVDRALSGGVTEETLETITRFRYILMQVENSGIRMMHNILRANNVRSVPIFHSINAYNEYLPQGGVEAVEVTLHDAEIIDTSALDWEHILCIRRDKEFTKKLRDFRLFINHNYKGKDKGYLLDSLNKKLDDYKDASKRHGLELVLSTVSQSLNSKSFLGSLAIVAACISTGDPIATTSGIVGGSVIEVGKLSVTIALKKLHYDSQTKDSELSYLVEVQNKLRSKVTYKRGK